MSDLHWFYLVLFAVCLLSCIQATIGLFSGVRFAGEVAEKVRQADKLRGTSGRFEYQPKVAVILPCCGVDERLHHTVERLGRQNYDAYIVLFTFESSDDPAYAAVGRWIDEHNRVTPNSPFPLYRRVIAGRTLHRSQKIHNLLAAVAVVPEDVEVLVFLDSDAVPNQDWLGHIVSPLANEQVGAATGFRWYCAAGGLANGVRCVWNAASITLMERAHTRFCWGGATAITRRQFEQLRIAEHWDRALLDDLQVSKAIKTQGLEIVFVPHALIPSHDRTTLLGFWEFARRQLVITRICAPEIWRAGLLVCLSFVGGGMIAAVLCVGALLGWFGNPTVAMVAGILWVYIATAAVGRVVLRQIAIRKVLHPPDLTALDAFWDITGALWSGALHLILFLASARGRRIRWRHIEYELISPIETRVISRADDPKPATNVGSRHATAAT